MSTKTKHIPMRTCVICRQKIEKRRLTRLVSTPDGVVVDPTGKSDGRGAYLCDKSDCRQRALQTQLLAKALRTKITDADRRRIGEAIS